MPKVSYEATFYYEVTLVREGTIEVDVPEGAGEDYNPFEGKEVSEIIAKYEPSLGDPEMIVDDENPEGERLTDVLLRNEEAGQVFRATCLLGESTFVDAPVDFEEDEEE